jgi:hypothetical protein
MGNTKRAINTLIQLPAHCVARVDLRYDTTLKMTVLCVAVEVD